MSGEVLAHLCLPETRADATVDMGGGKGTRVVLSTASSRWPLMGLHLSTLEHLLNMPWNCGDPGKYPFGGCTEHGIV